jgi:hypothetical protein
MPKKATTTEQAAAEHQEAAAQQRAAHPPVSTRLVQIRPGLFLNPDQIVSVRTLPQEEADAYAIMQLSNGDKLNLTRDEFSKLTGEEARPLARISQSSPPTR